MPDKPNSLQHIDFLKHAGLCEARAIKHGLNNHSYHVITEQGHYFVRLNAVIAGVSRRREAHILDLIAPLNISPKVVLNDLDNNVLITEWCRGRVWTKPDFSQHELVSALVQPLQQFHRIECPDQVLFLDSRLDQRLLSYVANQNNKIQSQVHRLIEKLDDLGFWSANQYLTHFDLNPRNIIGRRPPMLLDWEFSGLGHPLIDWLIIEYESGQSLADFYLHHDQNDWLPPLRALIQIMMQIWAK